MNAFADTVSVGGQTGPAAGLYSGTPLFKIIGAVELMTDERESGGEMPGFGDRPILI